ncbi:hypothetical protein Emed_004852 [Eimeria media]
MQDDGWGLRFPTFRLPRGVVVASCLLALCCSELDWFYPTTKVKDSIQPTRSWLPNLHAAAWSTEGFADEGDYIYEPQETPAEGSSESAPAESISAGATALMHASHPGVDPYGGALEQNDMAREDLVPSLDDAEARLQQIAQEEADMAVDDLINDQRHDLPYPEVFTIEPGGAHELGFPAEPHEALAHRFSWGPEVPQRKYAALERLAETFGLREDEREALPAFQTAASLLKFLEETFESWDVLLRQTASSSNQLFPSFFVLNKREEDLHKHLSQQEQRNRVLLAAQAAFLVYPLLIHLYKVFPQQPRSVQRSISAIAAFLNGKELLLVPAAIVPMHLYLEIAGDELPESTPEEADKKTMARAQLSAMLRGYSLRVLDSSQPQSPLMPIDKKALQQLSTQLMAELADPLEPQQGNWLQVSRTSAEKMAGFRLPTASLANSLQIIQQAREMSQSVAHLTRLNGSAMVKAYREIEDLQNAEARAIAAAAEAHAHPERTRPHPITEVDSGMPPSPITPTAPSITEMKMPGEEERTETAEQAPASKPSEEKDKVTEINTSKGLEKRGPLTEEEKARAARAGAIFKRLLEKKRARKAKEAEEKVPLESIKEELEEEEAEEKAERELELAPEKGEDEELEKAKKEEAQEEEEEKKEELKQEPPETATAEESDEAEEAREEKEAAEMLHEEAPERLTLGGTLRTAAAVAAFKRPLRKRATEEKKGELGLQHPTGEEAGLEEDEKEEEAEEKEGEALAAGKEPTEEHVEVKEEKTEKVKTAHGAGVAFRVSKAVAAFKRPLKRLREKRKAGEAAGELEGDVELEEKEEEELAIAEGEKAPTEEAEKEEGKTKDKEKCRGLEPIAHGQESLFLSNLEAFADEYNSASEEAKPLLVRKAVAALRDAEMREKGIAWMDSYGRLLAGIEAKPNHETFAKKLKDEPLQSKDTSKKDRKHVTEEAAKLLQEIAERTLMGQKTLQVWVECCNMNEAAKTAGKKEWGGNPSVTQSLDTRLMAKALKIIKKKEGQKKEENRKQFLKKLKKAARDTHTAMLQLHDSSGAKRRKNRKRKHSSDTGGDSATSLALKQRVAIDEVFAYTHLIGGIYMASSGASSAPAEREEQLQQMEKLFTELEEAKGDKERKTRAAALAEKAITVTILPPHQHMWALYSGIRPALKRFVKDQENKSLLSAFANRAESLCLSPRRIQKAAEAALHDPAFFGQQNEVNLAVQAARKQVARSLGAEKALGGEIIAGEVTPEISQLEKTISARLAQQALEKMHAETIDLLLSSLETHKYRRILSNAKTLCLLATYFPASSPFRPWLTGGHGAFVLRKYGDKEVVHLLEAKQREMEKEDEGKKKPKKKAKKTQEQQAQRLEAEYVSGLLMDPMSLPFELERRFTAEQFYSLFTKHHEQIKKAVAATKTTPPATEVQQTLGVARAHLDTLTSKLYRLSMAHLQTKKAARKAELVKAAVDACKKFHSPPDDLEDFFFGNHEFYTDVVEAYKSPAEMPSTHRDFLESVIDVALGQVSPFRAKEATAAFEKQLKRANFQISKEGKKHLRSLREVGNDPEEWKAKALQTPGIY